jgi:hypothetical protein
VHGEQHILNRVLNVIGIPDVSCRKRTKIRGYVLEQPTIGFLVAGLRAGHGDGPVQFAVSAAGNRRGLTDRGERLRVLAFGTWNRTGWVWMVGHAEILWPGR